MEKKEKIVFRDKSLKAQYLPLLEACKTVREIEESLVKNIPLIYNINTVNLTNWKYLTLAQKIGLMFEFIIDDTWQALTLRFSMDFVQRCEDCPKITDYIRRRINQNFKNKLGFIPEYLFTIEFKEGLFHIHGVINPHQRLTEITKILKISAFGRNYTKNPIPENKKIRCEPMHDKFGWAMYILKTRNKSGFDVYICNEIIKKTKSIYTGFQSMYKYLIRKGYI